nr:hypothetical protein [Gemmatimonadaceae bacterium]
MIYRLLVSAAFVCVATAANAQDDSPALIPDLRTLVGRPGSELAGVVSRFTVDRQSMFRRYDATNS